MKVLLVELHQSYSWTKDRKSMEYSVENQISNWLIAMDEEKNSSFNIFFILNTKFCCSQFTQFLRKNISAEFWPIQSFIGNVKRDICHVTRWDKWHLKYNVLYKLITNLSFNHPVLNQYPKYPHHHLLVGQKNLAKP